MHDQYKFQYLYLEIEEYPNYDEHPQQNNEQREETHWQFRAFGDEEINS